MTAPEAGGPLQGIRILDLTAVVMGPYATQTLGDLGADVIKVEPPSGDNLRAVGPMRHPGMGAMAMHLNRNKRSVVLDLKRAEGREACLRLAKDCDALIYNTRPQAMARLGLDYAAVAAVNPKIVYLGAFGYGEEGPYAGKPAYDDLIQGAAARRLAVRAAERWRAALCAGDAGRSRGGAAGGHRIAGRRAACAAHRPGPVRRGADVRGARAVRDGRPSRRPQFRAADRTHRLRTLARAAPQARTPRPTAI